MSELITLSTGNWLAEVDTKGAWVARLQYEGHDVLFPRTSFRLQDGSSKIRGGCHVCIPNFGPGGDSGLSQHGFGRDLLWKLTSQTEQNVELELIGGSTQYQGQTCKLRYLLSDGGLTMELAVSNTGSESFVISPGFHPYFSYASDKITVLNETYETDALPDPIFLRGTPKTLRIAANLEVGLHADGLLEWVLWSDRLGEYLCIEPTYGGFGFVAEAGDAQVYTLQPGQQQTHSLHIIRQ